MNDILHYELQRLVGRSISGMGFVEGGSLTMIDLTMLESTDWTSLHIQCPWRITKQQQVVWSSSFLTWFEATEFATIRDVEALVRNQKIVAYHCSPVGDVSLLFEHGYSLDLFASAVGDVEDFRLVSKTDHLVVDGRGSSYVFNSHAWADVRDHFFQQAWLHGYPKLVKLMYREVSDAEYCDNDLTLIFANDAGLQWRIHYSPVDRAVWIWNRERMTYAFSPPHFIDITTLEQAPWEVFEDLQAARHTPIYEIEYHPHHMHWVIR